MLKRIYQELVDIKKELQDIRSNLESREVENFDIDLLKKEVVIIIKTLIIYIQNRLLRLVTTRLLRTPS